MRQRCTNPNAANYINYGGRGITVCDRWKSFQAFYEDMGDRTSEKHTLDRKDNELGYFKENCRWATVDEQQNNRRNSVFIEAFGQKLTQSQWSRKMGVTRDMINHRINVMGMSPEQAMMNPRMSHTIKKVVKKKDGKVIAVYPSLAEAGRAKGGDRGGIWRALAGKNKTAYGFEWEYID